MLYRKARAVFSSLPWEQRRNLTVMNNFLTDRFLVLNLLPADQFQTVGDNIHWTQDTAERTLLHWCEQLQLNVQCIFNLGVETGPTVDLSQECFKSIGIVSPHRTSGAYAREGLTCIPVPKTHERLALRRDLHLYHRKIKRIISHKIGIKIKMPWRLNSLYPLTGSLYGNRWTLR